MELCAGQSHEQQDSVQVLAAAKHSHRNPF